MDRLLELKKCIVVMIFMFMYTLPSFPSLISQNGTPTEAVVIVTENTLTIHHAAGSTLEIFSLTGSRLAVYKINNDEEVIDLNIKKGCYLLKVDKVVRKIYVC